MADMKPVLPGTTGPILRDRDGGPWEEGANGDVRRVSADAQAPGVWLSRAPIEDTYGPLTDGVPVSEIPWYLPLDETIDLPRRYEIETTLTVRIYDAQADRTAAEFTTRGDGKMRTDEITIGSFASVVCQKAASDAVRLAEAAAENLGERHA